MRESMSCNLFSIIFSFCLFDMASRNDLNLEQKVNLIKDQEQGLSYREWKDKLQISIGAVSNWFNQLVNKKQFIHAVLLLHQVTGSLDMSRFLKHLGFAALPKIVR